MLGSCTKRESRLRAALLFPGLLSVGKGEAPGEGVTRGFWIAGIGAYLGGTFSPQSIRPLSRQSMMCHTSWFRIRDRLAVCFELMTMRPDL